jgi:tRNA(fMet)-specific endonuclease VapC
VRYLLDTCVVSELAGRKPNEKVISWIDSMPESHLFLSVITIGELRKGIEKLPDSKRKETLLRWFQDELLVRFADRILPIDAEVMQIWGEVTAKLERMGRPMPAMDSLIVAVALHGNLSLVTRNVDDFKNSGVTLLNPWRN